MWVGWVVFILYNLMFEEGVKEKQVGQLLKLQQLFHSQYLTQQLLNQLIGLYVRFVQSAHHDHQHPLRVYFMEKIRFVLSRPEVIRILEKETHAQRRTIRETVRGVMGVDPREEEAELKRMAEEAKAQIRQNHLMNRKDQHKEELREKERNMKIEMQLRIMQEVEDSMNSLRNGISKQTTQQKNQLAETVNKQDQVLDQRRANRKKRLRKKSADLTGKESVLEQVQPIAREELKQVQMEVQQTFERFTRLTQNRLRQESERKENEGRVKFQVNNQVYQEEDELFADGHKEQPQQRQISFKKKATLEAKGVEMESKGEVKEQGHAKSVGVNQGRVTVRKNQYEQLQEQEFL